MANLSDINENLEWYEGARVYSIFITIVLSICGILHYFGYKEALPAVIALSFVITFFLMQFFVAFIANIIPKKLSSKDIEELLIVNGIISLHHVNMNTKAFSFAYLYKYYLNLIPLLSSDYADNLFFLSCQALPFFP